MKIAFFELFKHEQEILETYADVRKRVADKQVMEIEKWISMNT